MPAVGRWKMLDNLRRSLLAPFTLAALARRLAAAAAGAPLGATLLVLAADRDPGLPAVAFAVAAAPRRRPRCAATCARSAATCAWRATQTAC